LIFSREYGINFDIGPDMASTGTFTARFASGEDMPYRPHNTCKRFEQSQSWYRASVSA